MIVRIGEVEHIPLSASRTVSEVPASSEQRAVSGQKYRFRIILGMFGLMVLCSVAYVFYPFNPFGMGTAETTGPSIPVVVVGPATVRMDCLDRTYPVETIFTVKNIGPIEANIVGTSNDCSCGVALHDKKRLVSGESMTVRVRVATFDENRDEYSQTVEVRTDLGNVKIRVHGLLPPSEKIRLRPTSLVLKKLDDRKWDDNDREIVIRIPLSCGVPKLAESQLAELVDLNLELTEGTKDDSRSRDWILRLNTRAGSTRTAREPLSIELATNSQTLSIPVRIE